MSTKRFIVVVLVVLLLAGVSVFIVPAQQGKVTICHAAGREGTLKYVELTLSYNAVYGKAGHFLEPGSPNAGHENDIEGPCPKTPTPTATLVIPTSTVTKTPILPSETPILTSTPTPKGPSPTPSDTPMPTDTPAVTETPTPTVVCPTACCYTIEVQIVVKIESEEDLKLLLEEVFDYLEEEGYACCASVEE
jgi:hypothetical protein